MEPNVGPMSLIPCRIITMISSWATPSKTCLDNMYEMIKRPPEIVRTVEPVPEPRDGDVEPRGDYSVGVTPRISTFSFAIACVGCVG